MKKIVSTTLFTLGALIFVNTNAQAQADPQDLLADAARQVAEQAMINANRSIDLLDLDSDFAPQGYSTQLASESAVKVFTGFTPEQEERVRLILKWDSSAEAWVNLGEPTLLNDSQIAVLDSSVMLGGTYTYASVLIKLGTEINQFPYYSDRGAYFYSPAFSVTVETESIPVPGMLRVAVILARFAETELEISDADMQMDIERVQSVYDELSYAQQIINADVFDTGRSDLSEASSLELLQSLQIMSWLYFNSPDFSYSMPCDIDAIALLAQEILDMDEFPDDFPYRFVTTIKTIDVEGVRPYGCEQLGAGGVLARHITIPAEINLQHYDVVMMHPYGDEPLGDPAWANNIHYVKQTQAGNPITANFIYIFQSGSPFNASPVGYGQLSDEDTGDGLFQDQSYTQGQLAQNLFSRVLGHELGHAMGIGTHANGANERMTQQDVDLLNRDPLAAISQLGGMEYGDYFGLMGATNYSFGMNPVYREFMGWLSTDRIQMIEQAQSEIVLSGLNSVTGMVAAKIPVDGGWIYVSYRPATGYDESLKIPELIDNTRGAMLHYVKDTGNPLNTSYLLDANDTIEDRIFVVLPGEEFSLYGVTIKNTSVNGNQLSFDVEMYATLGSLPNDSNGDKLSDILWRNQSNGQNRLWLMNGSVRETAGSIPSIGLDWTVAGIGDFDGDGKVDIYWRDNVSGINRIWFMDGLTRTGFERTLRMKDTNWQVGAVCDLNNDGNADIVWRHVTLPRTRVWLMNGATQTGKGALPVIDNGWIVAGCADFNNDGYADILWRHAANGQNRIWFMNGTTRTDSGSINLISNVFRVGGVGDFTNDGNADILFHNDANGHSRLWGMDGLMRLSQTALPIQDPAFTGAAVGDYGGDGRLDIFWRNPGNGKNQIWNMKGAIRVSTDTVVAMSPDFSAVP